jgi:hypothetical protein
MPLPSMPIAMEGFAMVALNDRVYTIEGFASGTHSYSEIHAPKSILLFFEIQN